ncbi:MAG: ATP-dependent Clp protease adapter ClpS [Bermanella sp.]|tara:strand:- start:643 stop:990 length:348 start_codon:yes stop_codon:yes gene_type:complete
MYESKLTLSMGEDSRDEEHGIAVAPVKPELKRPSMYQVIMLNDDYTPMDFVIEVLTMFFSMDIEKASQVMLAVHTQGKGICGVFTKDIAETKAAQVVAFAKENQHPLMCDVQQVK